MRSEQIHKDSNQIRSDQIKSKLSKFRSDQMKRTYPNYIATTNTKKIRGNMQSDITKNSSSMQKRTKYHKISPPLSQIEQQVSKRSSPSLTESFSSQGLSTNSLTINFVDLLLCNPSYSKKTNVIFIHYIIRNIITMYNDTNHLKHFPLCRLFQ